MPRQASRKTREAILEHALPLFAAGGFAQVSMRDIAATIGVTAAVLYHHFPDKERLYLDTVGYVYTRSAAPLAALLQEPGDPWQRLEAFALGFTRVLATDAEFRRVMQWVLLDTDERRLQLLVDDVFMPIHQALHDIASEVAPGVDPGMLITSLIGLLQFPYVTAAARRFLPDHEARHDAPEVVASHALRLLRDGIGGAREAA